MNWLEAAQWIARAVRYTGTETCAPHTLPGNLDGDDAIPSIEPADIWSHSSPAACRECAGNAAAPPLASASR
eukprot:12516354-Heterocapsa_arctica.AAC.1